MNRRRFIKSIGSAGLTTSALSTSTVSASPEKGIYAALKQLLRNGKTEQANKLCDQHGINYTYNTKPFSQKVKRHNKKSNGDVSTEKRFADPDDDPDSSISIGGYSVGNDNGDGHQHFVFQWDLASARGVDCHGPYDGAAISFSEDIYRNIPDTQTGSDGLIAEKKTSVHGYYAKIKTGNKVGSYTPKTGFIECEVDARDDEQGSDTTIYGQFIHTWDPFCAPSNWSVSWGLPGANSFDVGITGSAQKWSSYVDATHTAVE
ncbi:hypothetical protein [Halorussus pelagicus]|uniref:hypothetical protein n=1 Tax=Halorussus pelagicus TaxID=2505977 RepID=UPI000FFC6683|nr:hypothetical protein [Halorussus pelagicus]